MYRENGQKPVFSRLVRKYDGLGSFLKGIAAGVGTAIRVRISHMDNVCVAPVALLVMNAGGNLTGYAAVYIVMHIFSLLLFFVPEKYPVRIYCVQFAVGL